MQTALKHHHDPMYSRFSKLIQSTFDEAAELFTNNSIDLLHIDGFHTYESVKSDFYKWLPKMSDSGIVLLHDHCVHNGDFGVWKLWDELKVLYPCFEFIHGYGLAVNFVGKHCPESIGFLFQADTETHDVIRSYFYNLGMRWQLEHDLRVHKLPQSEPGPELVNENQSRITNYKRIVANHGWNFLLSYLYNRLIGKA